MKCPTCGRPYPVRERIICPECGKEVSITPAGNYNSHHNQGIGIFSRRCKMSRQPINYSKHLGEGI